MMHSDDYADIDGMNCPVCESADINAKGLTVRGCLVTAKVTCEGCGSTWRDVYRLSGYSDLEVAEA